MAVVLIFVVDLTLIVTTHLRWEHTVDKYLPIEQEMTTLRNSISEAHLWFEEVIGGDKYIDIEKDVMEPFAHKPLKHFIQGLSIFSDEEEYQLIIKDIQKIDLELDTLYLMAKKRWQDTVKHGIGSDLDQEFDLLFKVDIGYIDAMIGHVQQQFSNELRERDVYFQWILILFISVNILVFIVLYWTRREKGRFETALAREKEQAEVTMRSIGDAVITTDTDGWVTFLNTVAEELTGFSNAQAEGRPLLSVFNIINAKTGEVAINPVEKVLKHGLIVGLANHTVLIAKDGREYQIADSAAPIRDTAANIIGVVLVFRDVTKEYALQEKFEREQERLEHAINGTQVGLWDWDLVANTLYFSPRWKSMLGYGDDELTNELTTWSALVHPADLERAQADILRCQKSRDMTYENIHRLRHKDGHWVWILDRGQTIFDEDGKAVRMVGFHTDISQQKEAELALVESNTRYQMLFDESPVPLWEEDFSSLFAYLKKLKESGVDDFRIYFDANPDAVKRCIQMIKVEDVNQATLELHKGESKEQLLGNLEKMLIDRSLIVFKEELIAVAEGKMEFESEAEVKTLSGEPRFVYIRLKIKNDRPGSFKALLATTDITKRKVAEMALSDSEIKIRSVFRAAPIGIGVVTDRVLQEVNSFFCQITGYTKEELLGNSARMLYLSDEDYEYVGREKYRQIQEKGTGTVETQFRRKDGKVIDVLLSSTPLDLSDLKVGVTFTALDITQQKVAAQELRDKEEMMISQSRHAAMGEMISMIAHQWRQPLAVISMGANNMLVDIELEELTENAVKEQSYDILRQTQELTHTIDDFRDFFRPNRVKEKVDIYSVLVDTEKVVGPALKYNDITLKMESDVETSVLIHKRELIQVFLNLINNAKDAVLVHAQRKKEIAITVKEDKDTYKIVICDNGGGVDPAIKAKIFDPYFTTKTKQTGTGLGLYMSKTIIERHFEGKIAVENRSDENGMLIGACFMVSLPKY